MSPGTWLAVGVAALLLAENADGQGGIFDLGPKRATRAVVTFGESLPRLSEHESEMTRLLAGALADLTGKELGALRACVPPNPFLGDPTGGERIAVIHLFAAHADGAPARSTADKRVELVRTPGQAYLAVETADDGRAGARAELSKDAFLGLLLAWPRYRGGFDSGSVSGPVGEVFELPKPYAPGWYTMDKPTLGARFLRRDTTNIDGTDRRLADEVLYARVPRGYEPRTPAGLVIWIDAADSGRPPEQLFPALDDLGLICIGAARSGNLRHVSTRYQLAFDALATASERWHIDPRRVYLSGISGGGRVSSMLLGCFPDLFTGAVPIVGMSHYERVPTGVGSFVPAGYVRPEARLFRLLRERPMAPITGRKDFNYREITHATDMMRRDGLNVRVFGEPDMAHEMPTAPRLTEAVAWVDEAWRRARDAEAEAAEKALMMYTRRFGDQPADDAGRRRMLLRVTEAGPWTAAAWRAVELMRAGSPPSARSREP